jgi:dienelactone hydrolase
VGRKASVLRLLIFLCACLAGQAGANSDLAYFGPRLVEEQVTIPVQGGRYFVAATILRPDGPGPYGAVVLNHGVPVSQRERDTTSAAHFAVSAPVFARRGYVVVMPLRRGFGKTGGEFAEDAGPCSNPNFEAGEENAAADVMAAYDYARLLPYVDPSRMILAGQSAGAMASIFAAGMKAPRGLVAVLSFAGGRGGNPSMSPGVPCAIEPLAQVFDVLGKSVKAPVLFHYAQNDQYFGPSITRQWYERFTAGGARAEYVVQPPFGDDGHFLFADLVGVRHWLPTVERFLTANGVPFQRLDAADQMKQPLFGATLPYVKSRTCQGLYRVFLESPGPRAYAVSADGHCGFAGGMANARDEALRQCGMLALQPCALFAENEAVVWKQTETTFASVDAPQATRR